MKLADKHRIEINAMKALLLCGVISADFSRIRIADFKIYTNYFTLALKKGIKTISDSEHRIPILRYLNQRIANTAETNPQLFPGTLAGMRYRFQKHTGNNFSAYKQNH